MVAGPARLALVSAGLAFQVSGGSVVGLAVVAVAAIRLHGAALVGLGAGFGSAHARLAGGRYATRPRAASVACHARRSFGKTCEARVELGTSTQLAEEKVAAIVLLVTVIADDAAASGAARAGAARAAVVSLLATLSASPK